MSSSFQISQTSPYGSRATLAVPAQGIVDIRNTLSEFYEEYGNGEDVASDEDGKHNLVRVFSCFGRPPSTVFEGAG